MAPETRRPAIVGAAQHVQRLDDPRAALEPVAGSEKRLFGRAFAQSPTPVGILVSPDGRRAYVANTNSNLVAVLDLERLEVVGTIATGNEPDGLGWADR